MEENKNTDYNKPIFYWNSHEDPWKNERWTPYHSSAQEVLEEAYQKFLKGDSDQVVTIGNYFIVFEAMFQINKLDNSKVRTITRSEPDEISNPYNFIRPIIVIKKCEICKQRDPKIIFSPCGHKIACEVCANNLKNQNANCVKCKVKIECLLSNIYSI